MTLLHAFLLGIIQGLTEFVPVSSTAHLLIVQNLCGIPADEAMFSFLVIVQLGTIISPLLSTGKTCLLSQGPRSRLLIRCQPSRASLGADTRCLAWFLHHCCHNPCIACGLFVEGCYRDLVQHSSLLEASIRLFAAAVLLALAEGLTSKNRKLDSMTWFDALIVGVLQIISVFPGASRSGTTIAGGMFRGFDRPAAARLAFLMSVPVMIVAGGYQMLDVLRMPNLAEFLPLLAAGFVTAAIVGWFAIKWLIDYLSKHSLYVFAIYCAVVGTIVFFLK